MSLLLLWNAVGAVAPPPVVVVGSAPRRRRKRCPPVLTVVDALAKDLCGRDPQEQDLEALITWDVL